VPTPSSPYISYRFLLSSSSPTQKYANDIDDDYGHNDDDDHTNDDNDSVIMSYLYLFFPF
jgi:hypothetical protein